MDIDPEVLQRGNELIKGKIIGKLILSKEFKQYALLKKRVKHNSS